MQKTIKNEIHAEGIGLHSGKMVKMTLKPADVNSGIVFKRIDLKPSVDLKMAPNNIEETLLCTRLQVKDVSVSTIEHLMSAFCAMEIDNVIVELDADEVPVMDGSASPFLFLIQSAGVLIQDKSRRFLKIKKKIRVTEDDKFAELAPYAKGLKFSCSIDFDSPVISKTPQSVEYELHPMTYEKEISRARTFGFAADIEKLHANNLALGASLKNAVGIGDDTVLNPEGLRYGDEFVKHKLLDAIGDLYVVGAILGKFTAHKTSHSLNNRLLRKLMEDDTQYEWVTK